MLSIASHNTMGFSVSGMQGEPRNGHLLHCLLERSKEHAWALNGWFVMITQIWSVFSHYRSGLLVLADLCFHAICAVSLCIKRQQQPWMCPSRTYQAQSVSVASKREHLPRLSYSGGNRAGSLLFTWMICSWPVNRKMTTATKERERLHRGLLSLKSQISTWSLDKWGWDITVILTNNCKDLGA